MKKWMLPLILVGVVAVAGGLTYVLLPKGATPTDSVEVTWELLGQMDYISGKPSAELANLNHRVVRVPGFMVPLEDQQQLVSEFLLVPTPQACIHVPPPPSNQMVYIKMEKPTEAAFGPIWVYGTLSLTSKKHMYGEASFELSGMSVEPYR